MSIIDWEDATILRSDYYANDTRSEYESWAEFIESEGDADLDMNLVFRWDWHGPDPDNDDPEAHLLDLFYVGQRKGLFRSVGVVVVPEDEDAVREWLAIRWRHLALMWEPVAPSVEVSPS